MTSYRRYKELERFCEEKGCYLRIGANPIGISNNQQRPAVVQLIDTHTLSIKITFGNNATRQIVDELFSELIKINQSYRIKELHIINIQYIPIAICRLQDLTTLRINSHSLTELIDQLCYLKQLKELSLNLPNLLTIPDWVYDCSDLEVLDLYGSGIKCIPDNISRLKNLRVLDLCYTHLENISKEILSLDLVIKNEYWDSEDENSSGIFVYEAVSSNPPTDILVGGRVRLEIYYNKTELVEQREVRVLMLGLKGAGKTILSKRLKEFEDNVPRYFSGQKWTEGISFEVIKCPEGILKIWDFGGQEIMFSTHTLFLRDHCIYVIVLNARQGDQPDRFLEYINQYGKNSSVFIVANHMDGSDRNGPDINRIKRIFPDLNIIGDRIWQISCEYPNEYPILNFYQALVKEAIRFFSIKRPLSWVGVSKFLSDMKEGGRRQGKPVNYITRSEYKKICKSNRIIDQNEQEEILNWLCDLGVVFTYGSFQEIIPLNEIKVMRPEWIIDAIYRIINNVRVPVLTQIEGEKTEFVEDELRCIVTHDQIRYALENGKGENGTANEYKDTEIIFILDIMHKYSISLKWKNTEEFIPVIAREKELKEVALWDNEENESIVLDAVFQLVDNTKKRKRVLDVGSKHLYETIISIIKTYNYETPKMWRNGALWDNIGEYSIMLYLQNELTSQAKLRLLVKQKTKTSTMLPSVIYTKVESCLNTYSDGYGVEAKVLVQIGEKEGYISVDHAIKSLLRNKESGYSEDFEDDYSNTDVVQQIYGKEVLKEVEQLKLLISNQTLSIDEATQCIKRIDTNTQEIKETIEALQDQAKVTLVKLQKLEDDNKEKFSQIFCQDNTTWELLEDIRQVNNKEIDNKVSDLIMTMNDSQSKSGQLIITRLLSVLSTISSIVTISTADYTKVNTFIKWVMRLLSIK